MPGLASTFTLILLQHGGLQLTSKTFSCVEKLWWSGTESHCMFEVCRNVNEKRSWLSLCKKKKKLVSRFSHIHNFSLSVKNSPKICRAKQMQLSKVSSRFIYNEKQHMFDNHSLIRRRVCNFPFVFHLKHICFPLWISL